MPLPAGHPLQAGRTSMSPVIRATRGEAIDWHPVWFMRQAGRSLPEYRKVRDGIALLDSGVRPELAAEITLLPIRRLDVDAAVLFSDITVPLFLAGVDVEIAPGVGPIVNKPIRSAADVADLPDLDPAALAPVTEAISLVVEELGPKPLIGFAGAPFTLASYLIEGQPSRDHLTTKALMFRDPDTWHSLLAWTARLSTTFLRAQGEAGASALQLFDSWAGTLSLPDYEKYAVPHSTAVFTGTADLGLPRIHFGTKTSELLVAMRACGADVIGIDDRTPLSDAIKRLGADIPVQGNIDPAMLFAPWPTLQAHIDEILMSGRTAPGHIVNLGHGVPPTADPDVLSRVVDYVHQVPVQP